MQILVNANMCMLESLCRETSAKHMTMTEFVYKMFLEALRCAGLDHTGSRYVSSTDSFTVCYTWIDGCVYTIFCKEEMIDFSGTGRGAVGIDTIPLLEQFALCLERDSPNHDKSGQKRIRHITARIRRYAMQ